MALGVVLSRLRPSLWGGGQQRDLWLFVPGVVLVTGFVIIPILYQIYLSFMTPAGLGLGAYRDFLGQPQYRLALGNTVFFSTVSAVGAVGLTFPACLYVSRCRGVIIRLFTGILGVALALSGLVRAVSWQLLLGRTGIVSLVLQGVGLISHPLDILYTKTAVIIGMTQVMMPIAAMSLLNGLRHVDHELAHVAVSFGASPLRVVLDVYWPQLRRSVAQALLLVFTLATGLFLVPVLLGGPQDTVLGKLILSDMTVDFEMGAAHAAVSGVATLLIIVMAMVFCLILGGGAYHRKSAK